MSTVRPSRFSAKQDVVNLPSRDRIEAGGRFIEDVEIRIMEHRHRQGEALPLSTGQSAHQRLGFVHEIDTLEHRNRVPIWLKPDTTRTALDRATHRALIVSFTVRSCMNAVVCSCTPMRARNAPEARAGSSPSTEADPLVAVRRPSRISTKVVLPAPFGPEQADDLSCRRNREIDAAQCLDCAVGFLQGPNVNNHDPRGARVRRCVKCRTSAPTGDFCHAKRNLPHFCERRNLSDLSNLRRGETIKGGHGPPFPLRLRPGGQDLRHSIARLVRDRGFTAITIVTFALGIGANTAVFSLVKATLLSPLPYGDAERLTAIWGADRAETTHLSLREVHTYPRESQSFVDVAGYREADGTFTGGAEPELIRGGSATPNLFEVTRTSALLGRTFTPADTAGGTSDVIVISHGLWQRRFGGAADIIGRSIQVNGLTRTIIGVMPASFRLPNDYASTRPTEAWVPEVVDPANLGPWGSRSYFGLARLKDGVSTDVRDDRADGGRVAMGAGGLRAGQARRQPRRSRPPRDPGRRNSSRDKCAEHS